MCDSVLRWFVKLPVAACVAGGVLWMGVACHTAQAEDTQDVTGSELFRVMKTEKDALEKKLQDARVQVRQQQEQVSQLQSMNKELTGTIEALRGQLDDARRDVDAVQATLKAAEADKQKGLATLQQERERSRQLADVIKELRGLVAAQAEAVDAQKRQMAQLQMEARQHKQQAEEAVAEARAARERANAAQQQYEDTRLALREARATMHFNMGVIYNRNHDYRAAEKEYLTCLDINPDDRAAHYNLGILYQEVLRKPQSALDHYRQFLALNTDPEDREMVEEWIAQIVAEQPEESQ